MIRKLIPAAALLVLSQAGCVHWYNVGATFCGTAAMMCTRLEDAVPGRKEQLAKAAEDLNKSQKMLSEWGKGKGVITALEANISEADEILKSMSELSAQQKIIVDIVMTALSTAIWIIGNNVTFKVETHRGAKKFLTEHGASPEEKHYKSSEQLIQEFNQQVPNVPGAQAIQ